MADNQQLSTEQVRTTIKTAADSNKVEYAELLAVGQVESGLRMTAVSHTGVRGYYQITEATWKSINPTTPYKLDLDSQATTAAKLLSKLHSKYPDSKLVYLAYNAGEGTANLARDYMKQGMDYSQAALAALKEKFPNKPDKWSEGLRYSYKVLAAAGKAEQEPDYKSLGISGVNPFAGYIAEDLEREAMPAFLLENVDVSDEVYESLYPSYVITEGLDETPWFEDNTLLTGNPRGRKQVDPVVFEVILRDEKGTLLPDMRYGDEPLQLQLNASMKSISVSSKHVYHQQRTRTGWHMTLWGMQADVIEGSCTTGVFMNQFGLTHLYSISKPSEALQQLLTSGFSLNESHDTPMDADGGILADTSGSTDNNGVSVAETTGGLGKLVKLRNSTGDASLDYVTVGDDYTKLLNQRGVAKNTALRVAAQDAFAEFLALFKMNGNVWFWDRLYKMGVSEMYDSGPAAWSEKMGVTSMQMHAKNNDVITRGYVVMKFKANTYMGYFKNLSWTMDAETPFQWTFNFTFQVERTLNQLYLPR
jgi:hypothetical protein